MDYRFKSEGYDFGYKPWICIVFGIAGTMIGAFGIMANLISILPVAIFLIAVAMFAGLTAKGTPMEELT